MTIKTARQIFFEYPYLPNDGPMPHYVTLAEYEALLAILKRWQSVGSTIVFHGIYKSEGLEQLIADTQAAVKGE